MVVNCQISNRTDFTFYNETKGFRCLDLIVKTRGFGGSTSLYISQSPAWTTALNDTTPCCLTFSDAERVVTTRHEVVQCYKQIGVIFTGSRQQVLFRVPTRRLRQTRGLKIRSLKSFCKGKKKDGAVNKSDKHMHKEKKKSLHS